MDKNKATWVFLFYYFTSPLVCWSTGENMEKYHKRVWLELNEEEDK